MKTIAIGILGLALASSGAAAQTAGEQARILSDFQASVADYTHRHQCLDLFPQALNAMTPPPRIFTLPVAMVFRQMIAKSLSRGSRAWRDALPPLPAPLEYRLIGHDLVLRDTEANVVVGVLRDAVGPALTVIH